MIMETNTRANEKKSEIMPSDKGLLRISKVPFGQPKSLYLDNSTPWMGNILEEICDHYEIDHEHKGNCSFELDVLRKKDFELGDHLIINGTLNLAYSASCIRCLDVFKEEIQADVALVILEESYSKREEYEDVDELYVEEKERELYFYNRGQLDIKELARELAILELNPLPLHDAECKGLCFECGTNLNHEQCSHSKS